ncbi:hypothetical protein AL047_06390 [Pseudomonas syringae pv. broussonetiae]|nr:hypothetical protein AL047_06390 [Pseudomonas syringae pv. broussonetiae]
MTLFELLHLMKNVHLLGARLADFCLADDVEQFSRNRCWSWIKLIAKGRTRQGFEFLKCFKIYAIHRALFVAEDAKTAPWYCQSPQGRAGGAAIFRCSWSWLWTGRLVDVAGNRHQATGPGSRNNLTRDGQLEVASLALSDRSRIRHNLEGLEGKSGFKDNGAWKMPFNLLSYRFERLLT